MGCTHLDNMASAAKVPMFSFCWWSSWKSVTQLSCISLQSCLPNPATHFCPSLYYPTDWGTCVWSYNCTRSNWKYPVLGQNSPFLPNRAQLKDTIPEDRKKKWPSARVKQKQTPAVEQRPPFYVGPADSHQPRAACEFAAGIFKQPKQYRNCSTLIIAVSREILILPQGFKQATLLGIFLS